jgi:hypothetical protein
VGYEKSRRVFPAFGRKESLLPGELVYLGEECFLFDRLSNEIIRTIFKYFRFACIVS